MDQCFRFLFHSVWTSLGCVLAFAAVVIAGAFATGVPDGATNLFETYFAALPITVLMILFILSFNLCAGSLNLALSLGARRRDYFVALQGALVAYAGACWLLQIAVSLIPTAFSWANPERWTILTALRGPHLWSYPLLCLAVLAVGCACGMVFTRSRVLGGIILFVAILLGILGTGFLFVTSGTWGEANLGVLPVVLTAGAVATSVSHDSHNIICVGANDGDMAFACNQIVKNHGGIVVVKDGQVVSELPLEIAGVMSSQPLTAVNEALERAKDAAYGLGVSRDIDPFMTLSFMGLPVIPTLRLTTRGVVDVLTQQFI